MTIAAAGAAMTSSPLAKTAAQARAAP